MMTYQILMLVPPKSKSKSKSGSSSTWRISNRLTVSGGGEAIEGAGRDEGM